MRRPGPIRLLATAAIYVQIVLGAVMRHTGAGLAIPDFPAAFGGLWPSADELQRRGVGLHLVRSLSQPGHQTRLHQSARPVPLGELQDVE